MFSSYTKLPDNLPKFQDIPKNSSGILAWLWFFIRPYKTKFFIFSFMRLIAYVLEVLPPLFVVLTISYISSPNFEQNPNPAFYYMLSMGGALIISYFILLFRTQEGMLRDTLKRSLTVFSMQHIIGLSLSWHEEQGTGNKMQRVFTARDSFSNLIRDFFSQWLLFSVKTFVIVVIIAIHAPFEFVILFSIMIFVYGLISVLSAKKLNSLNDICNQFFENILGKVYEYASAVFTVKFMDLWPFVNKQAVKSEQAQQRNVHKLLRFIYNRWFYLNTFGGLSVTIIALYAVQLVVEKELSLAVFTLVIWYAWDVWGQLDSFAELQESFAENRNGFMRLTSFLKEQEEQADFLPEKSFPENWKSINFHNVSFAYDKKNALENINIQVPQGQKVALVGRSGSGKSTFVKLLFKQVLATKGEIAFDDVPLNNIPKASFLKKMSVVLQDTELFNISISENILLNSSSHKNLKKYLQMSHSLDFVEKLEEKENTVIGERGVKLSGGERQRIGIARALAQESEIIVFDEATSALDTESERAIQEAMHEIFQNKTAFVIAHRLSTIKEVDRILVFEKGKIIEDGSFDELIQKDKIFAKLWNLQKLD